MSASGESPLQDTMTATVHEATILSAYIEMATSSVANGQILIDQLRSLERCIGCKQTDGCDRPKRCDDCTSCGSPETIQDLIKQLGEEIPTQTGLVAKVTGLLNTLRARITAPQSPLDPQDTTMSNTKKPSVQAVVQSYQADVQNAEVLIRRVLELESEVNNLKAAAGSTAKPSQGGKDDCPEQLEQTKKTLRHVTWELEKTKRELEKEQGRRATVSGRLIAAGGIERLRKENGEGVASGDDHCREELKTTKKKLRDVTSELERTKMALKEAQAGSNQENDKTTPGGNNEDFDVVFQAGLAQLRRLMDDREEVVDNSEELQDTINVVANALLSNAAAPKPEVRKLKETIKEQQDKIERLEAELALQAQTPSDQVQSLKSQIETLKEELGDCQQLAAANTENTEEDLERCNAEKEKLKEEIRKKDEQFDTLRKEFTHGENARPAVNNTVLEAELKDAEKARRNAEGLLKMANTELDRVNKELRTQTKQRKACDEKYSALKEIDERRTRDEAAAARQEGRTGLRPRPGPLTPVTPGISAGLSQGQNDTEPLDDDMATNDGPDPGPGPGLDYEAEIEVLNHQIMRLEGKITALNSSASNDQDEIDALRSGSACNKKLLQNIDKLRKELADLEKRLDECRNETWQQRRKRLRLAAAANRRPRGTVPPRANRRLDPALQQQQEWAKRGWYGWGADEDPAKKRRKTK